jgi:hypothetical protein
MNTYCQIEHVDSDSDVGSPCRIVPLRSVLTAGLRFALTVALGAVAIRFVKSATTTTQHIPACGSLSRTNVSRCPEPAKARRNAKPAKIRSTLCCVVHSVVVIFLESIQIITT